MELVDQTHADLEARLLDLTDAQLVAALLSAHDRTCSLSEYVSTELDEALAAEGVVMAAALDRFAHEALSIGLAIRREAVEWADDE